ncbi:serine/threonine-protein kinase UCNL-like [Durio zibethinus]|uniref:non-specific serine/threonine protein kinase n=1 Tax=Durio zibethinus TaxID=66656 RepID=A0A6P5ZU27_DURZI|nr:serine/threonine-protein kinase UCNL-like [Durio zibethinus]
MENPSSSPPFPTELDLDNLKAIKILGKGAMGTVFLVHDTFTDPTARSPFALKVVQRSKHDADRRALWEIGVLTRLSPPDPTPQHPFLPRLLGRLETSEFLAWAVPYCPGSDLNVLRYRQNDGVFSPAVIRFYLAEIICALEHLHSLGIVYRDLKPENILIQQSGHVTLTDFDLSRNLKKKQLSETLTDEKKDQNSLSEIPVRRKHQRNFIRWIPVVPDNKYKKALKKAKSARVSPVSRRKLSFSDGERSNSFVGTEEYVSPEVIRGEGHEFAVDWWALGILTYEMLYGTTPFKGKNRKKTFRNVLTKEPELKGQPNALTDLIGRLLQKDPKKRLGYHRGVCEIKEHPFFKGVRWDLLTEVLRPPFIPSGDDADLKEKVTPGKIDIREYFLSLKSPSSMPPSPLPSPSIELKRNVSFMEY